MPDFNMPKTNPNAEFSTLRASHFCLRVPDYTVSKTWFIDKLDFRLVVEWPGPMGVKMAYLAAAGDDRCMIEIIGDGDSPPESQPADDLLISLRRAGYHHFCFTVPSVDEMITKLQQRGVTIVAEPFEVPEIGRRLAFFADPFGNMFEIEEKLV